MTAGPDPTAALGDLLGAAEDDALAALFAGEPAPAAEAAGPVRPSDELGRVVRAVAAPYVEIVAVVGARMLSGRAEPGALDELSAAVDALRRLSGVEGEARVVAQLGELNGWIEEVRAEAGRPRHRRLDRLRELLPRLGDALGGDTGARLRSLVDCDPSDHPLLADLASLDGIGPKRLSRLYSAGLFTAEVLSGADPGEVAAVTGLPRALAARVVGASRRFAAERERQLVLGFERRLAEFSRVVASLDPQRDRDLVTAARAALEHMTRLVGGTEAPHEPS